MRRLFVVVLSLGVLAAVTACVSRPPPSYGNCAAPAAPGVDWHNCDKSGTNLSFTDLSGANLAGANLSGADLTQDYLINTNLSGANLTGANLSGASLQNVNLSGANLTSANLLGAFGVPSNVTGIVYFNTICPDSSSVPVSWPDYCLFGGPG